MKKCLFCEIVKKEVDCFEIFEDEIVKAFLDINPVSKGHILVIPKKHFQDIFDVPEDILDRINKVCKKMALLCKNKLGATGVNILNASGKDAQQSVFHLHFHVVPRFEKDNLDLWFHGDSKKTKELKSIQEKLLT